MTKNLVGYKQSNGVYVYVDSINEYSIGVTLNSDNALQFEDNEMASNMAQFLNFKQKENKYIPVKVTITVEEVEADVITSE